MSNEQTEEQAFKDLQEKMEQGAELRGLEVNDDNFIVKFRETVNEIQHTVEVKVCRNTAQMEVISDENNIRLSMLNSIALKPTPFNLFEVESIINSVVKTLLQKIKI
jgi:hypothetical protein